MKCKYKTSNGRCGLKGSYAYRYKCVTTDLCKCHEPMTNADRIRATSDEELANFLHNVVCKFMCEYCKEYERIKDAMASVIRRTWSG